MQALVLMYIQATNVSEWAGVAISEGEMVMPTRPVALMP